MNIPELGAEIALIVESQWYEVVQDSGMLSGPAPGAPGFHIFLASLIGLNDNGIWVEPEVSFAGPLNSKIFVPWGYIVSMAVLEDPKKLKLGFHPLHG